MDTLGPSGGRKRAGRVAALTACWCVGALLLAPQAAAKEIFRSEGDQGEPVFSDRPSPGAQAVEVPAPNTVDMPTPPRSLPGTPGEARSAESYYQRFRIRRPRDDEAVRANDGSVRVELEISPSLKPSHRVRVLLDGRPYGRGAEGEAVVLTGVERGTHTLEAVIADRAGNRVESTGPRRFHVLRVSAITSPPGPAVPGGASLAPPSTGTDASQPSSSPPGPATGAQPIGDRGASGSAPTGRSR